MLENFPDIWPQKDTLKNRKLSCNYKMQGKLDLRLH